MKLYSFTLDELQGVINDSIEIYLERLRTANVISDDELKKMALHRITIHSKGVFGNSFDKVKGVFQDSNDKDELYYRLVELK